MQCISEESKTKKDCMKKRANHPMLQLANIKIMAIMTTETRRIAFLNFEKIIVKGIRFFENPKHIML